MPKIKYLLTIKFIIVYWEFDKCQKYTRRVRYLSTYTNLTEENPVVM